MKGSHEIELRVKDILKLNNYELKAYFSLLKNGKSKPIDIAKDAKIPIQRVYDTLKSLQGKGLIMADNNNNYEVIDPKVSFSSIANSLVIETKNKAKEIEELGLLINSMVAQKSNEEIKIIHGINQSFGHAISLIKLCNEKPYFMVYKVIDKLNELWPSIYELIDSIKNGAYVIYPENVNLQDKYIKLLNERKIEMIKSTVTFMDL
ncbi:MAG: helix-turn-helix domain-containing protein, partial [Caldisphaera sp.]|nr:helix-turn-helix domain-containing protein [Caldisphaera sp.]